MTVDKRIRHEDLPTKRKGDTTILGENYRQIVKKKNRIEKLLEMEDWLNELDPQWWLDEEEDKQTAPSEDAQIQRQITYKRYADGGGELNYPDFLEMIKGKLKKSAGITKLI